MLPSIKTVHDVLQYRMKHTFSAIIFSSIDIQLVCCGLLRWKYRCALRVYLQRNDGNFNLKLQFNELRSRVCFIRWFSSSLKCNHRITDLTENIICKVLRSPPDNTMFGPQIGQLFGGMNLGVGRNSYQVFGISDSTYSDALIAKSFI